MNIRNFINKILGRPLATKEHKKQSFSIITGLPALGLDSFASTAYGPEAALMVLLPLGISGLHYFLPITIGIVFLLFLLYLSYMQTIGAYPNGGGAYVVASENLGKHFGVFAAIALLIDYLLNVAVGISAGVGAIVSVFPALEQHVLILCLAVLFMLTFLNLRGARESGFIFILPVIIFVICLFVTVILGFVYAWKTGGAPIAVIKPKPLPHATQEVGLWLLLASFANGLTAMTGIEAVSNAVPIFRQPSVYNARWTLTIIIAILGFLLLSLGYLCPAYHIVAMDETQPNYRTILAQLVSAIAGYGIFYYLSLASIFIVLTYSAQTSFIGFPRVCRLLAEDYYLPHFFAEKGRRLVFTYGIVLLSSASAILLIAFQGITIKLIPLFAVGAFTAFLFSQAGMVVYWLRKKEKGSLIKLLCNALGATTTFFALIIIIMEKFIGGAWVVIVLGAGLAVLLMQIKRHYRKITQELKEPLRLSPNPIKHPIVIIPISGWNKLTKRAVQFGALLSNRILCVYVSTSTSDESDHYLRKIWIEKIETPAKQANTKRPKLVIVKSPYRWVNKPLLKFIRKVRKKHPDRLISVIIPELVEPHWYEFVLHSLHATSLRTLLFLERDRKTVVITIPWYLRES